MESKIGGSGSQTGVLWGGGNPGRRDSGVSWFPSLSPPSPLSRGPCGDGRWTPANTLKSLGQRGRYFTHQGCRSGWGRGSASLSAPTVLPRKPLHLRDPPPPSPGLLGTPGGVQGSPTSLPASDFRRRSTGSRTPPRKGSGGPVGGGDHPDHSHLYCRSPIQPLGLEGVTCSHTISSVVPGVRWTGRQERAGSRATPFPHPVLPVSRPLYVVGGAQDPSLSVIEYWFYRPHTHTTLPFTHRGALRPAQ